MSAAPDLIGIRYSPWTEKARWALDHHGFAYRFHEHVLIFGMPYLRWRMRAPFRALTVPSFVDGPARLGDSLEIALYADAHGTGTKLFPEGQTPRIREVNALSERVADLGRVGVSVRVGASHDARAEALPTHLPAPLRSPLNWVAKVGIAYLNAEFGIDPQKLEEKRSELGAALREMRETLKTGGGFATGSFSYADVALAAALQVLRPVGDLFIRLGPATRAAWTDGALASEFEDLLSWRDRLYAEHRPARKKPGA